MRCCRALPSTLLLKIRVQLNAIAGLLRVKGRNMLSCPYIFRIGCNTTCNLCGSVGAVHAAVVHPLLLTAGVLPVECAGN